MLRTRTVQVRDGGVVESVDDNDDDTDSGQGIKFKGTGEQVSWSRRADSKAIVWCRKKGGSNGPSCVDDFIFHIEEEVGEIKSEVSRTGKTEQIDMSRGDSVLSNTQTLQSISGKKSSFFFGHKRVNIKISITELGLIKYL